MCHWFDRYMWMDQESEPFCFVKSSELNNWQWEEVEYEEDEIEVDLEEEIFWFED